jgi:hypothetical protein
LTKPAAIQAATTLEYVAKDIALPDRWSQFSEKVEWWDLVVEVSRQNHR